MIRNPLNLPPIVIDATQLANLESYLPKRSGTKPSLEDLTQVTGMLETIENEGDAALICYSQIYDGFTPESAEAFRVSAEAFEAAERVVSDELKQALTTAKDNIWAYHSHQILSDWSFSPAQGITLGQRICPIRRVGLYIPGGKAAYPSTVLMNGIPARIAGVKEIALFTPPNAQGEVNPLVLYAAKLLGITEVYKLGGIQAIGAAAYGTQSVPAVDKIVGPGNRFVALAKKLVYGTVAIDMIAGPSEVLIIADQTAEPKWLAADLLAQAEHDEDAALYLVTTDPKLPEAVCRELDAQLKDLPKADIAYAALRDNGRMFVADTLDTALAIANRIAPEHLELSISEPESVLKQVSCAGSVFLGHYTPEALGDYMAGTNHTLPTNGTARFSSPLGVYDFITRPSFLAYSDQALKAIGPQVEAFAAAEGLEGHKRSVTYRLEEIAHDTPECERTALAAL